MSDLTLLLLLPAPSSSLRSPCHGRELRLNNEVHAPLTRETSSSPSLPTIKRAGAVSTVASSLFWPRFGLWEPSRDWRAVTAWKSFVSWRGTSPRRAGQNGFVLLVLRGGAACGPRLQVSGVLSLAVCSGPGAEGDARLACVVVAAAISLSSCSARDLCALFAPSLLGFGLAQSLQHFGKRGRNAVEGRGLRTVLCTVLTDL